MCYGQRPTKSSATEVIGKSQPLLPDGAWIVFCYVYLLGVTLFCVSDAQFRAGGLIQEHVEQARRTLQW